MKNLFSIDKSTDKVSGELDSCPFIIRTVSEELSRQYKDVSDKLFSDRNDKRAGLDAETKRDIWKDAVFTLCVYSIVIAVVLVPILFFPQVFSGPYSTAIFIADMVIVIGTMIFINIRNAKKRKSSVQKSTVIDKEELEASFADFEDLNRLARAELEIPKRAQELEVFPFAYRKNAKGVIRPADKKGHFDNMPILVWRERDDIYLSDSKHVLSFSRKEIVGKTVYPDSYIIDMWLKEEPVTSEKYAVYHIKKYGLLSCKAKGYYGFVIRRTGVEPYELLVPSYDLPTLELVGGIENIPEYNAESDV